MEERLQKLMAQAGLGSRRACEEYITAGRVTVNGRIAELGMKADLQKDRVLVDGRPLKAAEALIYIALNKPRGVLSAVESPDPRPTVRDLVDLPGHLYPVGRLDVDSEGLILLTNDGELANRLTHPRYGHEKEYRVLVARQPDEEQLQTWRRGVVLEDGYRTAPAEVRVDGAFGKGAWMRVTLREGRKRQIREMGNLTGLPVVKIIRIRIGSLRLGTLKPREWRYLSAAEVEALMEPESSRPAAKPGGAGKPGGEKRAQKSAPPGRKPAASGPRAEADAGGRVPSSKGPGYGKAGGRPHSADGPAGEKSDYHKPGRKPYGSRPATGKPPAHKTGKPGGRPPEGEKRYNGSDSGRARNTGGKPYSGRTPKGGHSGGKSGAGRPASKSPAKKSGS
jgi:23S rRNA pseudouridine2605 synthase